MRGTPRWISLNCCDPANISRRMSGVQRSANTSLATATGQIWPNPELMAGSLILGTSAIQVQFLNQ